MVGRERNTSAERTMSIGDLFAGGRDGAVVRERTEFDRVAGPLVKNLVLCGAGGFGRRTLKGLRRVGIEPIAFADSNSKLWGTQIDRVQCLSPADAAARHGEDAVFVMTMWKATSQDRFLDRLERFRSLGCRTVTTFGPLYWKYPEAFLPYFPVDLSHLVHEQECSAIEAAGVWADERSRREYFEQLRWRLQMNFDMGDPAPEPIYFPEDIFALSTDEVFVDCGAFDGDSVRPFIEKTKGQFRRVFAFEPDPENYSKLEASVSRFACADRITTRRCCVGQQSGTVPFSAFGTDNSVTGLGDTAVECVSLDDICDVEAPTYVKMDIEGYELDALAGMENILKRDAPKLAISAYHVQDHLWKIPLLIHRQNPSYKLFLRAHQRDFFDLVCYAIPS